MRPLFWMLILLGLAYPKAIAKADIIGFESFADGTLITNQYQNAFFNNARVLTAGLSLNELEFPPHSGHSVVTDDGGAITLTFPSPILRFSGYFTYRVQITIIAFDSLGKPVSTVESSFANNLALTGNPNLPNEFLKIAFSPGISKIVITGDQSGNSFSMDDIDFSESISPLLGSATLCLQDDRNGNSILINTLTGEFRFIHCGVDSFTSFGTGHIRRQGCNTTLSNNLVEATFVACTIGERKFGKAVFSKSVLGQSYTITDTNALNSTCSCN